MLITNNTFPCAIPSGRALPGVSSRSKQRDRLTAPFWSLSPSRPPLAAAARSACNTRRASPRDRRDGYKGKGGWRCADPGSARQADDKALSAESVGKPLACLWFAESEPRLRLSSPRTVPNGLQCPRAADVYHGASGIQGGIHKGRR